MVEQEKTEVLSNAPKLEFLTVGDNLVRHLSDCLSVRGNLPEASHPATWAMNDPIEIFNAVQSLQNSGDCNHIHRAFGEINLWRSVKSEASWLARIGQVTEFGKIFGVHNDILERKGTKAAGNVSKKERDRVTGLFKRAYESGKNWFKIAEAYGGLGTVIVFITASKLCRTLARKCLLIRVQDFPPHILLTVTISFSVSA